MNVFHILFQAGNPGTYTYNEEPFSSSMIITRFSSNVYHFSLCGEMVQEDTETPGTQIGLKVVVEGYELLPPSVTPFPIEGPESDEITPSMTPFAIEGSGIIPSVTPSAINGPESDVTLPPFAV